MQTEDADRRRLRKQMKDKENLCVSVFICVQKLVICRFVEKLLEEAIKHGKF